jgi:hypothetical protein
VVIIDVFEVVLERVLEIGGFVEMVVVVVVIIVVCVVVVEIC